MQSERQLRYWYGKYNARFFNNTLPTTIEVYWEPPLGAAYGETVPEYEVLPCRRLQKIDDHFVLRLNPALRGWGSVWKMTLLHEMAHISLWESNPRHQHGKVFQEEMMRLAREGAFTKLW